MTTSTPPGLGTAGRRLFRGVADTYELAEHELTALTNAARTADTLAALDRRVAADGEVLDTPTGPRVHPAVVEARQQRLTLARLLAALRLPDDEDDEVRPQRRGGARGPYVVRPSA